ncbi:glutaredoxin [Halolamina sp. CBA1230]|uniref:glutaredoxin family protein n=1 Tax=Halolamina sp. CBA1230 TaxID=1853690 RepID=UPI0009A1794A|nr:glutaredoxin domain-containing protein [Halolamina sp. CBA1230]QKY18951.1 glutaredoxin [Halolamina sp. CBA1230]
MSSQSELTEEEVRERVEEVLDENEVVLFMKGNRLMPQCGYSQRAVQLLSQHRAEFETIDVLPALPQYRAVLEEKSSWETIPQTFVDGEFVGGSDILAELDERDELAETVNASA